MKILAISFFVLCCLILPNSKSGPSQEPIEKIKTAHYNERLESTRKAIARRVVAVPGYFPFLEITPGQRARIQELRAAQTSETIRRRESTLIPTLTRDNDLFDSLEILTETLTPLQMQQFESQVFWSSGSRSLDWLFQTDRLRAQLDLNGKTAERYDRALLEISEEFQREFQQLRLEYRLKAIDALGPKRKQKFLDYYGEPPSETGHKIGL